MTGAALVTGGAKRMGAAMARHLAGRGFAVAINYASSAAEAEALVAEIRAAGGTAAAIKGNLLNDDEVAAQIPAAVAVLGQPLTVLVNNASIFEMDEIHTLSLESWDRHVGSNLKAPVFLTQAFAAQCPQGATDDAGEPIASGLVLNMLDQRLRKLTPQFMTYTLAKYGLWGFTQTAARALAPDIRVNGIGPGPTIIGARQSEAHFAAQRAATVLERGSSPAEILTALDFLLDSPGVTGQFICVDGGQHLGWETPDVLGVE